MNAKDIRKIRIEHGLTQGQLAEILDVDVTTVSRWERGLSRPGLAKVRMLMSMQGTAPTSPNQDLMKFINNINRATSNVLCYSTTPDLKVFAMSNAAARNLDIKRDEMLGLNYIAGFFAALPWYGAGPMVFKTVAEILHGKMDQLESMTFSRRICRADPSRFLVTNAKIVTIADQRLIVSESNRIKSRDLESSLTAISKDGDQRRWTFD